MLEHYLLGTKILISYMPYVFLGYIFYSKKFKLSIFKLLLIIIPLLAINIFCTILLYAENLLTPDIDIIIFLGFSAFLIILMNISIKDNLASKNFIFLIVACYAYLIRFFADYIQIGYFVTSSPVTKYLILNLIEISLFALSMPIFSHLIIKYALTTFDIASKKMFKFMWILPAFTLIIISFLELYAPISIIYNWKYLVLVICFLFIMLFTYLLFFNMLKMSNSNESLNEHIKKTNELIELQTKRYKMLTDNINATRIARHDIKHHLKIISQMVEEEKLPELKSYLFKYTSILPHSDAQISRNYAMDCLLRFYFNQAAESNIAVVCKVNLPDSIFVEDLDLCIMVGNLVENAIEAVNRTSECERVIKISLDYVADQLVITMDNPYDGIVKSQDGKYFSSKRNYTELGIGIFSVRTVVEKYAGYIAITNNGSVFSVNILINSNAEPILE